MSNIFDASSIFKGLLMKRVSPMFDQLTLELARYELLNVMWKHATLTKTLSVDEAEKLSLYCANTLDEMSVRSIEEHETEILKMAISNRLPVYDSAYLAIALENNYTLVSEDMGQRKVAGKLGISSKSFEDLL